MRPYKCIVKRGEDVMTIHRDFVDTESGIAFLEAEGYKVFFIGEEGTDELER